MFILQGSARPAALEVSNHLWQVSYFPMSTECNFGCCKFAFFKATMNLDGRFVLSVPGRLFLSSFSDSTFSIIGTLLSTVARGWLTFTVFPLIDIWIFFSPFPFCFIKKPSSLLKTGATFFTIGIFIMFWWLTVTVFPFFELWIFFKTFSFLFYLKAFPTFDKGSNHLHYRYNHYVFPAVVVHKNLYLRHRHYWLLFNMILFLLLQIFVLPALIDIFNCCLLKCHVCPSCCYPGRIYNFRQVRFWKLTIFKSTKYMFLLI